MKHFLFTVAATTALFIPIAASASPICVTQPTTSGYLEVDQTYLKAQVRNYSSASSKFELWVSPRNSGNFTACINTVKGQTKIANSVDGVLFTIQSNPLCNVNSWGYAAITLQDGKSSSDGAKQFVGRVPLKLDEYVASVHTDYLQYYDYNLVLNADKSVRQFCLDSVNGNMDSGSSSFWKPPYYPTAG